jgi:hypothetical protein
MKIEVSVAELRKSKIFIAMPTYGGQVYTMTMKSLLDQVSLFNKYDIEFTHSFLMNESLIQRARNYLADEFLNRTDCTHLMFIDSDIVFNPQDILAMLALDKEIVGGGYSKKSINWDRIKKATEKNPTLPTSEYEKIAGDIVFNPVAGMEKFSVSEPIEVMEVGTGFMLVKREVFEKYQAAYPQYMYRPDHQSEHFNSSRQICSFFNVFIDPESNRLLSEDYMWCQECRAIGIQVWMAPFVTLNHCGYYMYQGSLPAIAAHVGEM